MTAAEGLEGVWFGPGEGVFGVLDGPTGPSRASGVVVSPPFGWEDMASYPTRRRWAEVLAAAGHDVLRVDLPGTGDSPGEPGDPDELTAWTDALAAAAEVLRGRGCTRVTVLGLGFGGLVALAAADRGAPFDALVLWGTPADGRAFVRGERAFARFQTSNDGLDPGLQKVPPGWLESGGYLLAGATQDALLAVRPAELQPGRVSRALLLDKDGMDPDRRLVAALEAGGVDVTVAPGKGYAAMMATPEESRATPETMQLVVDWLRGAPPEAAAAATDAAPVRTSARLAVAGTVVEESVLRPPAVSGTAFGVLTRPADAAGSDLCIVLLPAWAERRNGPNRLWTRAARRCAARGTPAFRVDLPGVGDGTGDPSWLGDVRHLHDQVRRDDIRAVLDGLEQAGLGPRFALVGLCSGAYWALRAGAEDDRVVGVLAVNADGVLTVEADAALLHAARKAERLLHGHWWRQALRGQVKARSVGRVAVAAARVGVRRLRGAGTEGPATAPASAALEADLGALAGRGAHVVVACTANEPLHREFDRGGLRARLAALDGVRTCLLPSLDHNVRPFPAQEAVLEEFDRLLAALDDVLVAGA